MSNITIPKALLQQALEALEFLADEWGFTRKANRPERWRAIDALRTALAQQEPVAVHQFREANSAVWYDGHADHDDGNGPYEERVLYTHPPRREWQGLTEEEIKALLPGAVRVPPGWRDTVAALEKACKEKNQ